MIDPEIEKLLFLQNIDVEHIQVGKELEQIPIQRHRIKVKIEEQEASIEDARKHLMELEVRRNAIENEVAQLEDMVTRKKNQQLQVKKNEEYQALTMEIDLAAQKIGELEEEQIGLMLEIDEESELFGSRKGLIEKEILQLGKDIEKLNQREVNLEERKIKLESDLEEARSAVSPVFIQAYDQARRNLKKRPPFVAPIENGLCKRSNLRVSNELISEAKEHGVPHFDTETGCVVYVG